MFQKLWDKVLTKFKTVIIPDPPSQFQPFDEAEEIEPMDESSDTEKQPEEASDEPEKDHEPAYRVKPIESNVIPGGSGRSRGGRNARRII